MDVQAWCWLTRLREVVDRLRPRLRTFRDEAGVELFDLPEAPRPDPDVSAPPRLLPEYDNLLLSHADRTRVIAGHHRERVFTRGAFLVDGFVGGTWRISKPAPVTTLFLEPFDPLSNHDRDALAEEAAALLGFTGPEGAAGDVAFVAQGTSR